MTEHAVAGLLLAAGEGRRLGRPKALLADATGQLFVARALSALAEGGCAPVYAVLGAGLDDVRARIPAPVRVVVAEGWAGGMGVSLRAGLDALIHVPAERAADIEAVVVMLVDTPGVTADVVRRLVADPAGPTRRAAADLTSALRRASYDGVAGHPVLLGRRHWVGVRASARGDRGARDYLRAHAVDLVECGDIGQGDDIDTLEGLVAWRAARAATS